MESCCLQKESKDVRIFEAAAGRRTSIGSGILSKHILFAVSRNVQQLWESIQIPAEL